MFPRTVLSMDDYKIQGILLLFVMMTLVDRRVDPPSMGVLRCYALCVASLLGIGLYA